jgi:hypothetical protein
VLSSQQGIQYKQREELYSEKGWKLLVAQTVRKEARGYFALHMVPPEMEMSKEHWLWAYQ